MTEASRLLDHAAPSVIAPVGADLRVVARVRMVMPDHRVARMRVAMRVQVTEQDEDERSLVWAIKRAIRTLAIVAVLVAALAVGAGRTQQAFGSHVDPESLAMAVALAGTGGGGEPSSSPPALGVHDQAALLQPDGGHQLSSRPPVVHTHEGATLLRASDETPDVPPSAATSTAHAIEPVPAPAAGDAATAAWRFVLDSQRTPRPALATSVLPSPD